MSLERAAELRAKAGLLREALTRTGGFRDLAFEPTVTTAGPDLRYRSRLRLHIDSDGRVGLFAQASHKLVELDDCLVGPTQTSSVLELMRALNRKHPGALGAYAHAELRVAPAGPPVALRLHPRPGRAPPHEMIRALLDDLSANLALSISGDRRLSHDDQRWPLWQGLELHCGPSVFSQVNWTVNQALVARVVEGARQRHVARFCDLYCGAGNFTLPLLAAGLAGVAVDRSVASVHSAKRAARAAGLDHGGFFAQDVAHKLKELEAARPHFDLVLLDPPRRGARQVLSAVAELAPRFVLLCSCDPVTLARDLGSLARDGYHLDEVSAYDMFPHTHHLETLAWMQRDR